MRKKELERQLIQANGDKNFYLNHYKAMTDIFGDLKVVYPELFREPYLGVRLLEFSRPISIYEYFKAQQLKVVANEVRLENDEKLHNDMLERAMDDLKLKYVRD